MTRGIGGDPWSDAVAVAIVGTGRAAPPVLADLPAREGTLEARLLDAAAVLAAGQRAGTLPATVASSLEPAAAETLPEAPSGAADLLAMLFDGSGLRGPAEQLVEPWLQGCAAAGFRLPHRLIEPVFSRATRSTRLRPLATRVGGERGRWLAALNPAWRWATHMQPGSDPAADWPTATGQARVNLLTDMRATDSALGLSSLESTWATESASNRAALVATLGTGLSMADEPFLEAALDDRSQAVRREVQSLLAVLPASRRSLRMRERLRPLISGAGTLRKSLRVALPEEPVPAELRDATLETGGGKRGPRAAWLEEIIAGAPLGTWAEVSGRTPGDIVGMLGRDADADQVWPGLVRAAVSQRDVAWAEALAEATGEVSLIGVLRGEAAHRATRRLLRDRSLSTQELLRLLRGLPGPWSEEMSAEVMKRCGDIPTDIPYDLAGLVEVLGGALHPSAWAAIPAWIERSGEAAQRQLRTLHHHLTLREAITTAFAVRKERNP